MMNRNLGLWVLLFASALAFAAPDSLVIDVRGAKASFQSPAGIWWPKKIKKAPVVVWFHGGMSSGNCAKGLVAGADFAELYPEKIVVSV